MDLVDRKNCVLCNRECLLHLGKSVRFMELPLAVYGKEGVAACERPEAG